MIARVRGVIARSRSRGSRLQVSGSTSTNTGFRAEEHDHLHRCGEGERAGDHLVARLDVERHQRDEERVGAAGAGHRVLHADVSGEALLEPRDLGAEDVLAVLEHLLDPGVD